jgi:branched-chain polyamine synthase A-like protein
VVSERPDEPLEAVAEVVAGFGVGGRRLREAVGLLTRGRQSLDGLVRECALPRRTVEALVRAAGPDLDRDADGFAIRAARVDAYRARLRIDELGGHEDLAAYRELVARVQADIDAAPSAKAELDHVAATAETVVRRALWLTETFELAGARLLCVGDHDLSSLAVSALDPRVAVTVVDVDERLLEFIEGREPDVQCRYADFRFGLPDDVVDSADLVLTDPPYTPEGVRLFLGRGLQGLRDRANGRLVMAYGFSPLHPALGMKVQRAVADLDLVTEAILPAFNRYHGAQAVGSASDLYVCRPTARTWQVLDKKLARAAVNIYTHGAQSLEGTGDRLDADVAQAVRRIAAPNGDVALLVGDGWPEVHDSTAKVGLAALLGSGMPARKRSGEVAVDLVDDPGPWLLRVLLAVNADRVAVLVPNNHADLSNADAQRALTDLVAPKYSLRLRRSTPTARYAVVEATAVDGVGDGTESVAHRLLSLAHGKVANVWREALVRKRIQNSGASLTKNQARTLIADAVGQPRWLDARLIDLPRHEIEFVLAEAERTTTARITHTA